MTEGGQGEFEKFFRTLEDVVGCESEEYEQGVLYALSRFREKLAEAKNDQLLIGTLLQAIGEAEELKQRFDKASSEYSLLAHISKVLQKSLDVKIKWFGLCAPEPKEDKEGKK